MVHAQKTSFIVLEIGTFNILPNILLCLHVIHTAILIVTLNEGTQLLNKQKTCYNGTTDLILYIYFMMQKNNEKIILLYTNHDRF